MKAIWNGRVLAESDDIVTVEGNAYFPAAALDRSVVTESDHTSVCSWKGTAHYLSLSVDGQRNENAVWFYPTPKDGASQVKDRVAFWKGVQISA